MVDYAKQGTGSANLTNQSIKESGAGFWGDMARQGGTVLALTQNFFDLTNKPSVNIAVPAGAVGVEIRGSFFTNAWAWACLRVSFDGTTFSAGATDYTVGGGSQYSGTNGWFANPFGDNDHIYLSTGGDGFDYPQSFNAEMNLTRSTATGLFHLKSYSQQYAPGDATRLYRTYWGAGFPKANLSTALAIKALQVSISGGVSFLGSSWINVGWIGV